MFQYVQNRSSCRVSSGGEEIGPYSRGKTPLHFASQESVAVFENNNSNCSDRYMFTRQYVNPFGFSNCKPTTKQKKVNTLVNLKVELKCLVNSNSFEHGTRMSLFARYKTLRAKIHECLELLGSESLEESHLENLSISTSEEENKNSIHGVLKI